MIRLNISQQFAKLELNISEPQLNLKTTHPKVELSTEPAVLELKRVDGKMEIDQYPSRASYGYKNVSDMMREYAQEGLRAAIEAVGEIAAEGYQLTQIQNGQNQIANLARQSIFDPPPEFSWTPVERPHIYYEPGKIDSKYIQGDVDLKLQRGTVDSQLQRGQVEGYISQYQSIRFWTSNVDLAG